MKRITGLEEMVAHVAKAKSRAAAARFKPRPAGIEPPRTVYLRACLDISHPFESLGFKYAKSGPHLTRSRNPWKEQIKFQSSHLNVAGEVVEIAVHAFTWHKLLVKWRVEQRSPLAAKAPLAGGQIGNLTVPYSWLVWNIADDTNRSEAIGQIVSSIWKLALPYFDAFLNPASLARSLTKQDLPSLEPADATELMLFEFGKRTANEYLGTWLLRNESSREKLDRHLAMARRGDPRIVTYTVPTARLAKVVEHYSLEVD